MISTGIVAASMWWLGRALEVPIPFAWALVFGALISPTDPVAVLSTLRDVAIPESLEHDMSGESLFNDGVGVVLFSILSWGGVRGGISIALALSLPYIAERTPILAATYAVAVFSIVVQGLSLSSLARRYAPAPAAAECRAKQPLH